MTRFLKLAAIAATTSGLLATAPAIAQSGGGSAGGGNDSANYSQNRDGGHDWGWIGLLGLAGLAGLRRRDNDGNYRRDVGGRAA